MNKLQGQKTALITGGSRRIGRYLTTYFAHKGYRIIVHYNRSDAEIETLCNELPSSLIYPIQADFSSQSSIFQFLERIQTLYPIDLCINNASTFKNNSFQSMPNHDLMEDITVNTLAPILITNAMAKINHHAHVIQCSDARLEQHLDTSFSYAISKQLLETYTRIVKKQFPPTFRINTLRLDRVIPNVLTGSDHQHFTQKELEVLRKIADLIYKIDNDTQINQQYFYFPCGY